MSHRDLDAGNGLDQGPCLWRCLFSRGEIARNTLPQVFGLADVNDLAGCIHHAVNAGPGRQRIKKILMIESAQFDINVFI